MKKWIALGCLLLALTSVNAKINLVLDYATFYLPQERPYIELYLSINGNSISYAETSTPNLFQAQIAITYLIEKEGEVVAFEKFQLNSPEYQLLDPKLDILDIKRLPLTNGNYDLTIIAEDLITQEKVETRQKLRPIRYTDDQLQFSEIQLANEAIAIQKESAFSKNGIDIIPNISHAYGSTLNELSVYVELYNSIQSMGSEEVFLVEYKIVDKDSKEITANLRAIKRVNSGTVLPLLQSFEISSLPSGHYEAIVSVINKENKVLLEQSTAFFRSNPNLINYSAVNASNTFVDSITDLNEIREYIRCLRPISTYNEQEFAKNQLEYADLKFMQQFFLNFWKTRNAVNPEKEWLAYKEKVKLVQEKFGYGNIKGYTTERGRVYLQYGAPSAVQRVPYEANTYPYEIWQYNKLQGQTDRKFVFYSPSMEMLGYEVLHSNVRGEVRNPGWEQDLISKSNLNRRGNREDPGNVILNDRARDLFNNPR